MNEPIGEADYLKLKMALDVRGARRVEEGR